VISIAIAPATPTTLVRSADPCPGRRSPLPPLTEGGEIADARAVEPLDEMAPDEARGEDVVGAAPQRRHPSSKIARERAERAARQFRHEPACDLVRTDELEGERTASVSLVQHAQEGLLEAGEVDDERNGRGPERFRGREQSTPRDFWCQAALPLVSTDPREAWTGRGRVVPGGGAMTHAATSAAPGGLAAVPRAQPISRSGPRPGLAAVA
jgi:hypothetical protein